MASGLLGRLKDSVSEGLAARRLGEGRKADSTKGRSAGRRARGPSVGDASGTQGITISYAPEHDGDADPGEVVWAWVPYEDDPTQGKDRPVLILGHDGDLLAGVQLSSRDRTGRSDGHEWVPVGTGGWDSQLRPSYADASRLLRLQPREVRREGAALNRHAFEQVLARVAQIHDWVDHR